ncbi:DNA-methyltransferase [Acidiphilium sp.]|uniref:DNA-methyltransferase n=1 Tax=Acidiphilium sp. TaxID=527 RepID=UPI003CFDE9F1
MSTKAALVATPDQPKRKGRPRRDATTQGSVVTVTPIMPHHISGGFALDVNAVHAGNFIELAASLPDKSVDIIIADPPYNASKGNIWSMQYGTLPGFGGTWQKISEVWDDMPLDKYLAFTLSWLAEAKRLLKPTGSMWVHGTYHNAGITNVAMQMLEIEIINEIIWYKRNSFPNLSGRRLTASHETILWAHRGGKRAYNFNYERSKEGDFSDDQLKAPGKQMRTVWDLPNNKPREEQAFGRHPAQKPVRLARRFIQLSARSGDLCLVPFAGSGSECVAAKQEGLSFIGFETDPAYVKIADRRLNAVGAG